MRSLAAALLFGLVLGCRNDPGTASVLRDWDDELALTPDRNLVDIAGDPSRALWAVGNGVFRRDKSSWRELSFPGRPRELTAVATDGGHVWAVGRSGAIVHFDGTLWSVERVSGDGHSNDLVDVLAWPNEVWAIAAKGEIWRRRGSWQAWKPSELAAHDLHAAWGLTPTRVFVAAGTGIADFDGKSWRFSALGDGIKLRAIHGSSASDVWAVGEQAQSIGKRGVAFRLDASRWSKLELPSSMPLTSVYARSQNEVWVAGDQGTLLTWTGSGWQTVKGLPVTPVTQVFAAGPVLVDLDQRRIARAR
jgi:hypothetical protein